MERLAEIFRTNGFQPADYGCSHFDATLEKGRMVFVVRVFGNTDELRNWKKLQEEVNLKLYLKVDNLRKVDIYFVLFISFRVRVEDVGLLHEIEKDPYYCRKIIVRKDHFKEDVVKLPFLPVMHFEASVQVHRTQTIREFLDAVATDPDEKELAEKVFGLREERRIAQLFLEFSGESRLNEN